MERSGRAFWPAGVGLLHWRRPPSGMTTAVSVWERGPAAPSAVRGKHPVR